MVRTQAQLTELQLSSLKRMASEEGVSVAELIRRGVDVILRSRLEPTREQRVERAIGAIGGLERFPDRGGADDISVNHDRYLDGAFGSNDE